MNKVPMRRICTIAEITPDLLYHRIGFFASCARALSTHYERQLFSGERKLNRLYLSTDRQEYSINWTRQDDRRNVILSAAGTACNDSGYVFAMQLNFDSSLNLEEIEKEAAALEDHEKPPAFRKFARCWLKIDYKEAAIRSRKRAAATGNLSKDVSTAYDIAQQRSDIEASETISVNEQLPTKGVQIHSEYTLYAHFFYLRKLLAGVEKLRFFVDQDSPMRAACMSAFHDMIRSRKADLFYVRINKDLTINEKRALVAKSKAEKEEAMQRYPGLDEDQVEIELIKEQIPTMRSFGKWNDRWLIMPFPKMNEPEKAICHLTDLKDYDLDHLARLYRKASLHGVDRFFMLTRRRLSLMERPISTSSASGRVWYGYSPYNPNHVEKILTIFRTYFNYCIIGDGAKETAAMRLGLCDHRVTDEEFLSFF